jgi:hypothetical protein
MRSDETARETPPQPAHRLLDFLPAIYRRSPELEPFLAAFEATLFKPTRGGPGTRPESTEGTGTRHLRRSVEEQVERIPQLLDPYAKDDDAYTSDEAEEFLAWLSQWAAVTLFHEARDRRQVITEMIRLYRTRGTPSYVKETLELYVDGTVTVAEEDLPGIAVGRAERSRVGHGTRLGEDTFRFSVRIDFSHIPRDRQHRLRLVDLARRVIDLAKPAYTHYHFSHNLFDEERGFTIGVRSTVGVDTLLEHGPSASRERHSR